MKIVYATLEDAHSIAKLKDAAIPEHAAVFVQIGGKLFALEDGGHGTLGVSVQQQLIVVPGMSNSVKLRQEVFK